MSCQHPFIWPLLDSLKKQQALTVNTVGETQREDNDKILNIVSDYTPATTERMLRGIAYNYFLFFVRIALSI